jgi:hypothetical protein
VPQAIVAGAVFVTDTLATGVTVSVAFAAAALLPAFVVSAPAAIVFAYAPAVAAVTSIWNVQVPLAGTVPPVNVTLPDALITIPPAQVVDAFGVAARTMPAPGVTGKVSVTLVTVIGAAFGLVMVMVSVDVAPEAIGFAEKAFAIVGGAALTVKVTLAEFKPVGASTLDTPVAKLGCIPGVLLRTTIETVHEPLAGMVKPVKFNNPV